MEQEKNLIDRNEMGVSLPLSGMGMMGETMLLKPRTFRFAVLIATVLVTGVSQGFLLPVLAVLLEQAGVNSAMNGFNAAALYIGIFVTSFFIEKPVRRFGYRPVILFGVVVVTFCTLLFPVWSHLWFWFFLRLAVGVGDSSLHYATQLWITTEAPAAQRGKMISAYGFAYGVGFSIGPLGLNLLSMGVWVPFVAVSILYVVVIGLLIWIPNSFPVQEDEQEAANSTGTGGYFRIWKWVWLALLPSFLYGYMEASLNGNFPVYGLRNGLSETWVSLILPSFVVGSLVLQIPLGAWSDRVGRKKILMLSAVTGGVAFCLVPYAGTHVYMIMALFAVAGAFVGSFYSLGLAFLADILPKNYLPKASVMAGILFSLGSIIGPNLGGMAIEYVSGSAMFYLNGGALLLFFVAGLFFRPRS